MGDTLPCIPNSGVVVEVLVAAALTFMSFAGAFFVAAVVFAVLPVVPLAVGLEEAALFALSSAAFLCCLAAYSSLDGTLIFSLWKPEVSWSKFEVSIEPSRVSGALFWPDPPCTGCLDWVE